MTKALPLACTCCLGTDTEVDDQTGLCLYCQPCPDCGRMGTACDYAYSGCDPVEYPDRPRRPFWDVMREIAAAAAVERQATTARP